MLLLLLMLQGLGVVASQTPVFLQAPANVTRALGHDPVTFACQIEGQVIHWLIDGQLFSHLTLHMFFERGVQVSLKDSPTGYAYEILTMLVTTRNNNSAVVCQAIVPPSSSTFSEPATLNVAGIMIPDGEDVPLPPSLQFSTLQADTVQVEWSEPFTWEGYPITGYFLTINVSETEDTALLAHTPLISSKLSPDAHNYTLTSMTAPTCTNLTFSMKAASIVGDSLPGIVFGALPGKPGVFTELPGSEVTFARDQTPILHINFTFPSLCPYNEAAYALLIEDKTSGVVVHKDGPHRHHWSRGMAKVTREIRNAGLLYKREYNVTISVWTLVGESFIEFEIDTFPEVTLDTTHPLTLTTQTESLSTEVDTTMASDVPITMTLAMLLLAVVLGVALIALALIVFAIYCHRRCKVKRKRERVGTIQRFPMVSNPIYEAGAIYEEILANTKAFLPNTPPSLDREDSYVTIAASRPNDMVMGGGCKVDDTYLPMRSVGVLKDQLAEQSLRLSMEAEGCLSVIYANSISSGSGRSGGKLQGSPDKRMDRKTSEKLYPHYI